MQKWDLAAVLHRSGTATVPAPRAPHAPAGPSAEDALEWSWPPYAPVDTQVESFDTADWAPSSVVWHPQVKLGRWTVVYRRS